jgi:hypothetical protein
MRTLPPTRFRLRTRRRPRRSSIAGWLSVAAFVVFQIAGLGLRLHAQALAGPNAFYATCDAARDGGVAPIYANEAGYREGLDRDGDGIACEPWRDW